MTEVVRGRVELLFLASQVKMDPWSIRFIEGIVRMLVDVVSDDNSKFSSTIISFFNHVTFGLGLPPFTSHLIETDSPTL